MQPVVRLSLLSLLCVTAGGQVVAQTAPAFWLTPSVSISETLTNNLGQTGLLGGESDAVTRGTVGVNLRNRSGRAQGALDYAFSGLSYARHSEFNTTQQSLNANLALEWWEKQGFLQATAQIGQGAVSAFGAQPNASGLPSANSIEVRTLSLAPRWQGPLFGDLKFSASTQFAVVDAQGGTLGDSTSSLTSFQISPQRAGPVVWSLQASVQANDFKAGTATSGSRGFGAVTRAIDKLDLQASATAGLERGNLVSSNQRSASTWGLGLVWTPSPRTSADLKFDQRLFGRSHAVTLQHRTPLTVWRITSTRTLNESGSSLSAAGAGSLFELYFSQFASVEPDPIRRADLVNAFLLQNGLVGASPAGTGFLRSAATLDNRQDISVAWRGVRNTATLTYGRSQSQRANTGLMAVDDLSSSQRVNTETWSLAASHRLTPSLTATATASLLSGNGLALGQSNRQRTLSTQLGGPVGPKATWSLVLRRALIESQLLTYGESTAIASITMRF